MLEQALIHAVIDEAGDTGRGRHSSSLLVVAGVVCSRLENLERVVLQTRKGFDKKLRQIPELKASHTPAKVVSKLLQGVSALDVEIYAVVIDKRLGRPPVDPEEWYRDGLLACVGEIAKQHRRLNVLVDQRYTNKHRREKLIQFIEAKTSVSFLSLNEANSHDEKALQVADAVAWSIFQKHTWETDEFYRIIEAKVKSEIIVTK